MAARQPLRFAGDAVGAQFPSLDLLGGQERLCSNLWPLPAACGANLPVHYLSRHPKADKVGGKEAGLEFVATFGIDSSPRWPHLCGDLVEPMF